MAEPKKYIGNCKKRSFDNGGYVLNGSVSLEKLKAHVNEKGYVNITISENREPDRYGNTHAIYINEWKPKPKEAVGDGDPIDSGDIPFS